MHNDDSHDQSAETRMSACGYEVIPSEHYLVSDDGQIRFTASGRDWFGSYLARAGIDIHVIKTYDDFMQARQAAAPWFMDRMAEHLDTLPNTDEHNLMRSALLDEEDVFQKKVRKYDLKKSLKIVK